MGCDAFLVLFLSPRGDLCLRVAGQQHRWMCNFCCFSSRIFRVIGLSRMQSGRREVRSALITRPGRTGIAVAFCLSQSVLKVFGKLGTAFGESVLFWVCCVMTDGDCRDGHGSGG